MKRVSDKMLIGLVVVLVCVGAGLAVVGFGGAGAAIAQPTATPKKLLSTILKVSPIGTQPATAVPAQSVPMTIEGVTAAPAVQAAPVQPTGGGYVCAGGAACVKGNINSKGEKIYHYPGCPSYNQTKIDKAGEQLFVSEADAIAAGWTKAANCK